MTASEARMRTPGREGGFAAVLLLVSGKDTRPWWTGSIMFQPIFFVPNLFVLNGETAPVLRF